MSIVFVFFKTKSYIKVVVTFYVTFQQCHIDHCSHFEVFTSKRSQIFIIMGSCGELKIMTLQ